MTDDLHSEIGKLHQHIQHVSHQIGAVQSGQDRLHAEHAELRDRVEHLERTVTKDVDRLTAHEHEAEIYRGHLLQGFERLNGVVTALDTRFAEHISTEEEDRREVIRGQRTTIRSILLAAVTFVATGFALLWQTGGLM